MNGLRACLLLWMLLVPLCGHAAQTLRLVADPWPPFNDQTLLNNGLASDLVTTALERAGYLTTYAQVPWARAVRGLQQEAYDVLINAWYTDERAVYGHYSQPYLVNRVRFLQRKNAGINFTQLSDLYPYSIAVVRDYAYSPAFGQDARLLIPLPPLILDTHQLYLMQYRNGLGIYFQHSNQFGHVAKGQCELVSLNCSLSFYYIHIQINFWAIVPKSI